MQRIVQNSHSLAQQPPRIQTARRRIRGHLMELFSLNQIHLFPAHQRPASDDGCVTNQQRSHAGRPAPYYHADNHQPPATSISITSLIRANHQTPVPTASTEHYCWPQWDQHMKSRACSQSGTATKLPHCSRSQGHARLVSSSAPPATTQGLDMTPAEHTSQSRSHDSKLHTSKQAGIAGKTPP